MLPSGMREQFEYQMHGSHRESDQHDIVQKVFPGTLGEQEMVDQHKIVGIEYEHERQRDDHGAYIAQNCHRLRLASGEEERQPEEDGPGCDMDQLPHAFEGGSR